MPMLVDTALEHTEVDALLDVDADDPRDRWVGVLATDDRILAGDRDEPGPNVAHASPDGVEGTIKPSQRQLAHVRDTGTVDPPRG
jgi:hypothetical protein